MRLAVVAALAVLLAAPCRAQEARPPVESELAALAAERPNEVFARAAELSPAFADYLRKAGRVVDAAQVRFEGVPQTNAQLLALLASFKAARERAALAAGRKIGVELGSGYDPTLDDQAPPFAGSELDRLLSWQVRADLRLDGAGMTARYKHPRWVRSLNVNAHAYADVPGELGLDHARDEAYKLMRRKPYDKKISGYEAAVYARVTERWEARIERSDRQTLSADEDWSLSETSLDVGFSPGGEDPRQAWRRTWWLGAAEQDIRLRDEHGERAGEGLAMSAGYALRRVFDDLPLSGMSRVPVLKSWRLDQAHASAYMRTAPLDPFNVRFLADVTTRMTRHFHLMTRAEAGYAPRGLERKTVIGARLGLKYKS